MVTVGKEAYDKAVIVGQDVVVGGNIDGIHTFNRMYALYRGDNVVAYTVRQIQVSKLGDTINDMSV